jgi:hypothetical protein
MSSYSLSSLQSTTKYGIAGFLVGAASAYSLCSIWSDSGSSSSRSSSSGSGYDDNNSYNSSGTGNNSSSSMFGGGTARHRKKGHKKTRGTK